MKELVITSGKVAKKLLLINCFMALIYLAWWFVPSHVGNPVLYSLLLFGEIYHVCMAFGFWYTMWPRKTQEKHTNTFDTQFFPSVAIFITVAGEPVDIIEQTATAAKQIDYPNFAVYILNDGYVANKSNWKAVEEMAQRIGVYCITRKIPGGAKAGNINHALRQTESDVVAILDADMVPHPDFLKTLIPYLKDEKVGFVQSPQYYKNYAKNDITAGAWEQQHFFFGPIMQGKNTKNAAFICGTNVVIRRTALMEVGGINEKSIAEDFLTSLFIHKKKWQSIYIQQILCEGLAPEDLLSYYKQQQRWARGSLEVLFAYNPFFKTGLTMSQRIQYLLSALYYFNGVVVLIDMIMPLFFLVFGMQAVSATTISFAFFFIPYMFLNLYTIYLVSHESITFRAISFSQSSWMLQITALIAVIFRRKTAFAVTAKKAREGNFLSLIYPHLSYVFVGVVAFFIGYFREGLNPAVITNTAWMLFNIIMFMPFIKAAYHWETLFPFSKNTMISANSKSS